MNIKWITYYYIIGFFCISCYPSLAQDQRIADSLRKIYLRVDPVDTIRLKLLWDLSFNEVNDFTLALSYTEELIQLAQNNENLYYQSYGYFQKGNKKKILGDLDDALDAYLKSITIAKKSNQKILEGSAYDAIANIYAVSNNHNNAMLYYHKAITILSKSIDSVALATTILNAGDEYLTHQSYDSALLYFTESRAIFEQLNHLIGKAYNLGNIGMVYANISENTLAEQNINEAIQILEESGDFYPVCFYLISMSDIYQEKGDVTTALNYAHRSLELAQQYQLKQQISDANLKLSELHETASNSKQSLKHFREHIVFRDSVNNIETIQNIADQRTEFEVSLKETEIDLLEQSQALDRTYIVIAITLLLLSVVVLLYFRQRFLTTKLLSISERKQHSEKVKDLLNSQETKALLSLVQGRDNERKRLAQELHNHFGSVLATIKVNINGIDETAIENHGTLTTLVDQACSDIRDMSHKLNMGISEDFGLVPALKELSEHVQKSGGLQVEFAASMCEGIMDSKSEIVTYRIVQELISNTLKHAEATKLTILLTCFEEDNLLNILIHDNGKGFNTKTTKNKTDGMGLGSLKKMVTDLEGDIKFDSNPTSGTTVNIDLPFSTDPKMI